MAAQWAGFRTVAFCEIEPYAQRVLAKNFGAVADTDKRRLAQCVGVLPNGGESAGRDVDRCYPPIHSNIFDFDGKQFRGASLLTGGFPCQPFSVAGKRRGAADDRHLWPEMLRVIAEARPAWVLGENVPGIIPMELDNVLSDLEGIGYACRPFVIPACAVDARHRRDRLWVIGRDVSDTRHEQPPRRDEATDGLQHRGWRKARGEPASLRHLADPAHLQRDGRNSESRCNLPQPRDGCSPEGEHTQWAVEPDVGRVAHGIPARVDRLRGLGNSIVPPLAYEILKAIRAQIA